MLAYEAKRKPAIAELVARAPRMTDEEIESIPLPLPWYRLALKELRIQEGNPDFAAYVLSHVEEGYLPDVKGHVREWLGDTTFIDLDRGALEVRPGALVFFPNDGGVWIETLFSRKIDRRLLSARFVGDAERMRYIAMYKARVERLTPAPVAETNTSPSGRELPYGIRITRL